MVPGTAQRAEIHCRAGVSPASHALKPHCPSCLYEELVTRRLDAALEEIRGEGWRDEITNLEPAKTPCCHLGRVDRRTIQ